MKSKRTRDERIGEAMRIVWSSLDSHIDFARRPHPKKKDVGKRTPRGKLAKKRTYGSTGSPQFHRQCVREYARLISILADLY